MRALHLPLNYDHPQRGQREGFQRVLGPQNVREFDYLQFRGDPNAELLKIARDFRPDWIWMQLQETNKISAVALTQIRSELPECLVTHWTGDMRPSVSPYLASICAASHVTFASSVGQLPAFKQAGAPRAEYLQIGVDRAEDLDAPVRVPPFPVTDVVFCGHHYGRRFPGTVQREQAIRSLMGAGIDVGVVGQSWPRWTRQLGVCDVKQQVHVWRGANVGLCVNHFNNVERYYSDRLLIAMGSGTPVVAHYVPGLEHEFENGKHLLWYQTLPELVAHVRSLLDDPQRAAAVGEAGREEIRRAHTWEHRVRQMLEMIDG